MADVAGASPAGRLHVLLFHMKLRRRRQFDVSAIGDFHDKPRLLRSTLACALALSFAAPAYAASETKPKKEPSAAQMAARERMTKCSGEWKDAKAGGKARGGHEMAEILEPVQYAPQGRQRPDTNKP